MPKDKILEVSADELLNRFGFVSAIVVVLYHVCNQSLAEDVFWDIIDYKLIPEIKVICKNEKIAQDGDFKIRFGIVHNGEEIGCYAFYIDHVCAVEKITSHLPFFDFHRISGCFNCFGEIYIVKDEFLILNAWDTQPLQLNQVGRKVTLCHAMNFIL